MSTGIIIPPGSGGAEFQNPGLPDGGDGEMSSGGDEQGGSGPSEGDLNQQCQFIDGQWVCETTPSEVQPETPTQTQCPTCNQVNVNIPPSGTRGNYFWDSKKIIETATKPLTKKKNNE